MEKLLALEMVRVTEAAAIASARLMGRGDRDEADHAAIEAMRRTMDEIEMAGTIVIGEGERDEAPMLYIGEQVGRRARTSAVPEIDIAVDPLEGTNLVATARPTRSPSSPRPSAAASSTRPDTYLEKLCVGPVAAGHVDIARQPDRERPADRRRARPEGRRHHRRHPRPAAPRGASSPRSAPPGARIKLITDGDLSAAISCAVSGTGVHAVMGIGGAPEGVLTAAALRCLGGEIQARFRFRNDEERERARRMGNDDDESRVYRTEDLASGDNLVFAATGVTERRPAPGRPLLRRRRPDPLAGDGLPDRSRSASSTPSTCSTGTGRRRSGSRRSSARQSPTGIVPASERPDGGRALDRPRRRRAVSTRSPQPGGTSRGARSASGASTNSRS